MIKRKDFYFKKAKKEGFLARSAYKLIELNGKYNLIRKNSDVLDIGCSPGGWVQVCLKLHARRVVGIDIEKAKIKDSRFEFVNEDVNEIDVAKLGKFDVVLSDISPKTKGFFDSEESADLSRKAWKIAVQVLKPKGNFLCKIFQGAEFDEFCRELRKYFYFFKISKPKASRKESREMYLIGKGFLGDTK
ncbi:RlmE family RNA methyltransferase [Candidatus Woesearchaeota archaeon]|nr:RlmE family RNA methyltransferase [Candidatus Woesearchaeota archaeon]